MASNEHNMTFITHDPCGLTVHDQSCASLSQRLPLGKSLHNIELLHQFLTSLPLRVLA